MNQAVSNKPGTRSELQEIRQRYAREQSSADMLRKLSEHETNQRRAQRLARIADLEQRQADYWLSKLPETHREPRPDPCVSDRVLNTAGKLVGSRSIIPAIAASAARRVAEYEHGQVDAAILELEREVAAEAAELAAEARGPIDVSLDHRRQTAANGSLRAAIFGVNDGLVSNLSLVMGVAGAAPAPEIILLAGLAGLLAGSFSMAAGEYISMLSQRELLERQLEIEREHIRRAPDEERRLLADRYAARGLSETQAGTLAERILDDPDQALDVIAREQLGLDPEELGSPIAAAIASFASFGIGAIIPILPFLTFSGLQAAIVSSVLSIVALFLVGWGVAKFTGRSWIVSALRMVVIGGAAAAITYGIGRAVGVNLGG
ncbi:MAG TPA: VIT1/CCC1 transporter family protein [Chloroflexota bacterium]|jgi:vacuolar iron transporter family protein|nr:VIT1/CCC1 transporter family protein [Chloroflexota bacterium]